MAVRVQLARRPDPLPMGYLQKRMLDPIYWKAHNLMLQAVRCNPNRVLHPSSSEPVASTPWVLFLRPTGAALRSAWQQVPMVMHSYHTLLALAL